MEEDGYRVTVNTAKRYRTLSNHCGPRVDVAWKELDDEFGEKQPIKISFMDSQTGFPRLKEDDMINTIHEFREIKRAADISYRKNKTSKTGVLLLFCVVLPSWNAFVDVDNH